MLNNCTIIANECEYTSNRGMVTINDNSTTDVPRVITNCIFWLNKTDPTEDRYEIYLTGSVPETYAYIRYCDIEEGLANIGGYGYYDYDNIINNDPEFETSPEFYDQTIEDGFLDAIFVEDANKYTFGDIIEYNDDNFGRAVTYVDYIYNVVVFDPPLSELSQAGVEIKNWGSFAILEHGANDDYDAPFKIMDKIARLDPNISPCIDAGLDSGVPADTPDLDGDGDILEQMPYDIMGVPRLQDIPSKGDANVVDMAAFESGGLIAGDVLNIVVTEDTNQPIDLKIKDLKGGSPTYVIVAEPKHGSLDPNGTQGVIYVPNENYYDEGGDADKFYYKAFDGINYSEIAKVAISQITAVDDNPVAVNDSAWINPNDVGDGAIVIPVVNNDYDPDGDKCSIYEIVTQPGNGAAVIVDGNNIKYTPDEPCSPVDDSFTYRIQSTTLYSEPATVIINANHRPVASDDIAETELDIIAVINVLANDTDEDGHSLEIAELTQPATGNANIYTYNEQGAVIVYKPAGSTPYGTSFTYKAGDEFGIVSSSPADVNITVLGTVTISDLDSDNIADSDEGFFGTDANDGDSDDDGFNDGDEVMQNFDPTNPYSGPPYSGYLPYTTCFHPIQGYAINKSVHGQLGWEDLSESSNIEYKVIFPGNPMCPPFGATVAALSPGTKISKGLDDNGAADDYSNIVWTKFYPVEGAVVRVLNDTTTLAAAKFVAFHGTGYDDAPEWEYGVTYNVDDIVTYKGCFYECQQQEDSGTWPPDPYYPEYWKQLGSGTVHYLDGENWIDSETVWTRWQGYPDYRQYSYGMVVKFVFNFKTTPRTCTLYWDPYTFSDTSNFVNIGQVSFADIDSISKVEFEADSAYTEVFQVRGIYINDEVEQSCRINYPLDGDNVQKSRIPIKGECSAPWMSGYKLIWWPVNWESGWIYHKGGELVNGPDGVLGYWNTGALPKGIYHLGIHLYDDLCYPWLSPRCRACEGKRYLHDNYDMVKDVATSGCIASQTFHLVEEPDISVPWPGEFPFELRRIYDSGRQDIEYPFFPGWTNNHQIILTEYAEYYESSSPACSDTAKAEIADSDAGGLAFGAVYVQYENGSMHLFRHTTGSVGSYDPYTGPAGSREAIYTPYPDDGSGDYIKRTTSGFVPYYYYDDDANALLLKDGNLKVHYELYRRDGTKIAFHDINEPEVVSIPMGGEYTGLYKANQDTRVYWCYDSDGDGFFDAHSEAGPTAAYPSAGFLPFNAAANKSGGAVYRGSRCISGHYFLPSNSTSFYPYRKDKWRFITAVKTKSDRFGNTLHYDWVEHYYYPFVHRATYKPDDGSPEVVIEFGNLEAGHLKGARLRVGEDEILKEIRYHGGYYWTGWDWSWVYSTATQSDLLQVSTIDVTTGEEKDFTSYKYWHDSGYLSAIFNDELVPSVYYEAPWNARTTLINYDYWGNFTTRWDYTETYPYVERYESSDKDKYLLRNYWYFFFEPDSGNEEEGQCVLTSWDNYDSDNLTIPYCQDLSIINERGQVRSRIANPIDAFSKLYNYRYEGDYPFTPTTMHEIWLDCDIINNEIDEIGKIILNDYTVDKIDFSVSIHPNNPDVNCLDLTAQSIYEMGYEANDVNKEDPNTLISYSQMDYHAYAGFNLPVKQTSYQTLETKPVDPENPQNANDVNTVYVYGLHDGTVDPCDSNNVYLIQKWVLIDDKDTPAQGDDEYAKTYYEYNHLTCQADPCHTPPYWKDAYALTKTTDPCGSVTVYVYDANHYKQWVKVGPDGAEVPIERCYHDQKGQVRLKADTYGLVARYDYDNFGDVIKTTNYFDPDALDAVVRTDFTPQYYEDNMTPRSTTIYTYDTQRRRIAEKTFSEEKGPDQVGVKATEYLSNSDLTSEVRFYKSQSDYELNYDTGYDSLVECLYGGRGLRLEEEHIDATGVSEVSSSISYWYDAMDRIVQTDWKDYGGALLKRLVNFYNGSGQKAYDVVFSSYGGSWGYESRVDYIYDHLDRLEEDIVSYEVNELGLPVQYLTTFYGYDGVGNRTSITAPDSNIIFFDYDNANRQVAEYFAEPCDTDLATTKASAVRRRQTRYYDNDLVRDVNSYDYGGTDLLARSEFVYDKRGRVIDVSEAIAQTAGQVTDAAVTTYAYQDAKDSALTIDGKKYANVTITDPCNETTQIAYSERGDVVKTIYPDGDYAELMYNGHGALKKKAVWDTGDLKQWVSYYYDSFLRLEDVNYPDAGNVHYDYDGFGRNTKIIDSRDADDKIGGSGQITYEYDALHRIIDVNDQDSYHVEYKYRADNQKESITVNNPSDNPIYQIEYEYDMAGRLTSVKEPLLTYPNQYIAGFGYNDNGNRSQLAYYLNGSVSGPNTIVTYTYNRDNMLTGYSTSSVGVTGPTFTLNNVTVDGLGRLAAAGETITNTSQSAVNHSYTFAHDMRSQLTNAEVTNAGDGTWTGQYGYHKNGDMISRTIEGASETFSYTGNLMTDADGNTLDYDDNGNMTTGVDVDVVWNWENKLRSAESGTKSVKVKYDPLGNRIWKRSVTAGTVNRKYIVDIVGGLPVILLELDPNNSNSIEKTHIYANSQILAQHDGPHTANRYFYLHDRLGSVRQLINTSGNVVKLYTYEPFGKTLEDEGTLSNPFMFTGQYYDSEIDEYYLRARQYDLYIYRFTSRDPAAGKLEEPMTLHAYLYCQNDPLNTVDPSGLWKDGIRYFLRNEFGIADAYSLSDAEIEARWPNVWDRPRPTYLWHGHSDMGYLQGDFDYTTLDHLWWTRPENVFFWPLGLGTDLHFRKLEGWGGAEMLVGLAIRAGNEEFFEQAMHMGQDYFSHIGRGYDPIGHLYNEQYLIGVLGYDQETYNPDNPYSSRPGNPRRLNSFYRQAQRWTKYFEEIWYLVWDMDTWLNLP
ncbi:MAG: hypothetical protein JSV82_04890 [Planctomycetota bacterium]|nr:MAG: hypothetical protein JSV82_04890 [Planctomycetota bacterium]